MIVYYGGLANPGNRVTWATKFCTVAPNICRPSVQNWIRVTFQLPEASVGS